MPSDVEPVPAGYHTVTPYLLSNDPAALIDFLSAAFGAVEEHRSHRADGSVGHAQVRIGDSPVMLGGTTETWKASAATLYLYVEDTDALYERAIRAGATSLMEPEDKFYGDRNAGVTDPQGNQWWIATHVEDVSEEELGRRMAAQGQG